MELLHPLKYPLKYPHHPILATISYENIPGDAHYFKKIPSILFVVIYIPYVYSIIASHLYISIYIYIYITIYIQIYEYCALYKCIYIYILVTITIINQYYYLLLYIYIYPLVNEHNCGTSPFYSWVNQWPFSISFCMCTRG